MNKQMGQLAAIKEFTKVLIYRYTVDLKMYRSEQNHVIQTPSGPNMFGLVTCNCTLY